MPRVLNKYHDLYQLDDWYQSTLTNVFLQQGKGVFVKTRYHLHAANLELGYDVVLGIVSWSSRNSLQHWLLNSPNGWALAHIFHNARPLNV